MTVSTLSLALNQNRLIIIIMESPNVICKRYCFPSLTKLMKLREDTKNLCDKLENIAQNSFVQFNSGRHGKRAANLNEAPATPRKKLRKEQPVEDADT